MATATAVSTARTKHSELRIPALDGWRGIAIILVLVDHVQSALTGGYVKPWLQTGQHGVTIFFVLSGYLITSKLLERPINLKRFYTRRFFRLMPVAWLYLLTLSLLTLLTRIRFTSFEEVRACALFYRNFSHIQGAAGHFWSLSLEEQFYIVWPCALLIFGVRRCRWFAIGGAISVASYRWLNWAHYNHIVVNSQTQVRADALLVGCLLAITLQDQNNRETYYRWIQYAVIPSLVVLCYCFARYHWLVPLYENLAIAVLIAASLSPCCIITRFLTLRILTFLGLISYSVYVWQEVFTAWHGPLGIFMLSVAMPLFSLGSYYCVERPCTRLGQRIASCWNPTSTFTLRVAKVAQ